MEIYIDKNSDLRKQADNDFEKDLYKLLNNSVFGCTCENIRNRINLKLVSDRKKLEKYSSWISFKDRKILEDDGLIVCEFSKMSMFQNKPVYVGQSILDISKMLMYRFHYEYILNKFGGRAQLLFTDTDSLAYMIRTEDFYDDVKNDVEEYIDTGNYPKNHLSDFLLVKTKKFQVCLRTSVKEK